MWAKMWRIADGKLLCSADREYTEISPDGQFLITSDNNSYRNKNPKVWRIADGQCLFSTNRKYKQINPDRQRDLDELALYPDEYYKGMSPDGQFLVIYFVTYNYYYYKNKHWSSPRTIDEEKKSEVWRIADGKCVFSCNAVYREISPDGQFLLTTGNEYRFSNPKVWRIADGQCLFSTNECYTQIRISLDWQFLLTYDDEETKVWRIADGKCLFSTDGYYREISSDGQFLLTSDGTIKVWRIADGKRLFSPGVYYTEISSDGHFLVTSDDKETKVWQIADEKCFFSVYGKYREISPDGHFLVTSDDKETKVWSIDVVTLEKFINKNTQQFTIQDFNTLKQLDTPDNYVYSGFSKEKLWIKLIIELAKFKLSFEVEIEENQSLLSGASEFDIEIED